MRVMPVASTTLVTIGYDHGTQLLRLQFHSRTVYYYYGVSVDVYQSLLLAPSKGAYFNRNIRGRFPFQKLLTIQPSAPAPGAAL